ncbi:ABC1-domain-containing protein [Violaceomyces palustris]|uniref:ABC1-domain-containing protein n=1 Tax=Violaceomyces palustris TaxID=1673888 RepID=A0ACD0P318_9BASI|nr:ABC1-domain-containing protein [Violaceomyces palustris]
MTKNSLSDAAVVASAVCTIAKRVILQTAAATGSATVSNRPWPSKVREQQQTSRSPDQEQPKVSSKPWPSKSPSTLAARASASPPSPDPSKESRPKPPADKEWETVSVTEPLHSSSLESDEPRPVPSQMTPPPSALGPSLSIPKPSPDLGPTTSPTFDTSLPPLAPDGTPTEMRVLHDGGIEQKVESKPSPFESKTEEEKAALLKRLDQSLSSVFGQESAGDEPLAKVEAGPEVRDPDIESEMLTARAQNPDKADAVEASEASNTKSTVSTSGGHVSEELLREGPSYSKPISAPEMSKDPDTRSERENEGILDGELEEYDAAKEVRSTPLKASKVPSSRLGRLFHYGGLGAGLALGAAGQYLRGGGGTAAHRDGGGKGNSLFMSEQNVARLVDKLSTMRGAALKLGQFLSIQDANVLPPQIESVMLRVQNSANYMPKWQMERVMREELGEGWRNQFESFDEVPFAAASIGQVHSAVLRKDHEDKELAGKRVAVKVQFPGVKESIKSDLSYLRWLVSASALLPKGLFLDNTIRVMSRELEDECDYVREAEMGRKFGKLLEGNKVFEVPRIVDSLCSGRVLTTEMMRGRPLTQAGRYSQEKRDQIAKSILELSLRELFSWRLMQTDPNWTNFLYNERNGKIQLIDFGATREYSKAFMDEWFQMLQAAIRGDRQACVEWSEKVGYLTGAESQPMRDAHVDSMIALGEPFRSDAPDPYPFEKQTITDRVRAQIPLMLRERLTPPPEETYSLNRKLSGAFLLCARLKAHVSCRGMMENVTKDYVIGEADPARPSQTISRSPDSFGSGKRSIHTSRIVREAYDVLGSNDFRGRRDRFQPDGKRRHGINLTERWARVREWDRKPPSSLSQDARSPLIDERGTEPTGSSSEVREDQNLNETKSEGGVPSLAELPSRGKDSSTMAREGNEPSGVKASLGPTVIRGITIPLKPPPPGPEECCMSGCAHCAYDIYAEDLESYHEALSSVRRRLLEVEPRLSEEEWKEELLGKRPSGGDEDGGTDSKLRADREVDEVIGNLDPTMKAFLEMERRMKKQQQQQQVASA